MVRTIAALVLAIGAAACASAPPVPPAPQPAGPSFHEKMSWILRLEDQRVLRDPPPPPVPPPPPPAPVRGRSAPVVLVPPAPPPPPDLVRLLADDEARIRRRAALAIGRVGLGDGVQPLVERLTDTDPEVKQMAAFALGLIGDARARDPLVALLSDASPLVQGSAAEGLGLIGDAAAAAPIGQMVSRIVDSGALTEPIPDESESRRDTPAAAFRLGLTALVRLKAYEPLAAALIDGTGRPRVTWWPAAFALQRIEDARAVPTLLALAQAPHPYTRAFAIRGLGNLNARQAVPLLLPLVAGSDHAIAVEAIRAIGRIGDPAGAAPLLKLATAAQADGQLRLEAVSSLGGIRAEGVFDALLDIVGDPSPPVRAAAIRSLAQLDPAGFVTVLSGLDPDPHWAVRAALASVLGELTPEAGLPRLRSMVADGDARVVPAVLESLVKLRATESADILRQKLKDDDPGVRAAAAAAIGQLKPADGPNVLADAYSFGNRDALYVARAAALEALSQYGATAAVPVLSGALSDKDWAVRTRAATLLKQLDPGTDAPTRIRPAPSQPAEFYAADRLTEPSVSPEAYIDTDKGTIKVELAVLDAPITVENFMALARKGFFDGLMFHRVVPGFVVQTGDPRGDGQGGPGFTIRDELNERPYLRGAVGMALDWADTGGSQFFITHSPQPHLDGRYTVFGRVTSGMEVVDQLQQWDVVRRVRVWDGETMR